MIIIGFGAWFVGVWGFSQIVGGIQNLILKPKKMIPLIILWTIILAVITVLVLFFLGKYKIALFVGYGIALIQVLTSGKIS